MSKRICRVSGVVIHNDQVLLHTSDIDDFWVLPGGGCEEYETTTEALKREMKEEINQKIEIHRLLSVVENFFEYDHQKHHSIEFYYLISFPDHSAVYDKASFDGYEDELKINLQFQWHPVNKLHEIELYPECIKEVLKEVPDGIEHIINREYGLHGV